MNSETEKIIEMIFKVVVILASLGVVVALFKKVFNYVKQKFLFFVNLEQRITDLEKRKSKTTKTKTKK